MDRRTTSTSGSSGIEIAQQSPALVLWGKEGFGFKRPWNPDIGVVPDDTPFIAGAVVFGNLIEDFGVGQGQKPVGKSRGDIELPAVFGRQFHSVPPAKSGRIASDIHGHVENSPPNDPDEFSLRIVFLKMKTPQDPLAGKRVVILDEGNIKARRFEILKTIGFHEKTPFILKDGGFYQYQPFNGNHGELEFTHGV